MTNIAIDIEKAPCYGLAECKAKLSELVSDVELAESGCVIMRYGRPTALLLPLPEEPQPTRRARGLLSSFADASAADLESGAFGRAMVAKHADA